MKIEIACEILLLFISSREEKNALGIVGLENCGSHVAMFNQTIFFNKLYSCVHLHCTAHNLEKCHTNWQVYKNIHICAKVAILSISQTLNEQEGSPHLFFSVFVLLVTTGS